MKTKLQLLHNQFCLRIHVLYHNNPKGNAHAVPSKFTFTSIFLMSVSLFGKKSKLKINEHKTFSEELFVVQKVHLIQECIPVGCVLAAH